MKLAPKRWTTKTNVIEAEDVFSDIDVDYILALEESRPITKILHDGDDTIIIVLNHTASFGRALVMAASYNHRVDVDDALFSSLACGDDAALGMYSVHFSFDAGQFTESIVFRTVFNAFVGAVVSLIKKVSDSKREFNIHMFITGLQESPADREFVNSAMMFDVTEALGQYGLRYDKYNYEPEISSIRLQATLTHHY